MNRLYEPLLQHADDFALSKLYVGALGSHERIMQLGKTVQMWRNMAEFDKLISDMNGFSRQLPHNLNYTVTPRNRPESKKPYVAGSTCFWADVDNYFYYRWKQIRYPKLINTWLEPNIIVDSGWGVHIYWLFDSFVPFGEGTGCSISADKFNMYMKMISWYLSADQTTAEHLLRVPGTYNCKSSPDKLTEIYLMNEKRRVFSEFADDLDTGIRSILAAPKTPKSVKDTIEGILRVPQESKDHSGTFTDSQTDIKNIDKTYGEIKKKSSECRLLEQAFYTPENLSYMAWFSIGASLNKTVSDPRLARELFYRISLPGNRTSSPQEDIYSKFDNIRQSGHMPYGGSKVPECTGCRLFSEGKCRNIITMIRRAVKKSS